MENKILDHLEKASQAIINNEMVTAQIHLGTATSLYKLQLDKIEFDKKLDAIVSPIIEDYKTRHQDLQKEVKYEKHMMADGTYKDIPLKSKEEIERSYAERDIEKENERQTDNDGNELSYELNHE